MFKLQKHIIIHSTYGDTLETSRMGEVTKTRRTLIVPNQAIATYVTQWSYDSWNRVQTMTYPDGEVVTYTYDKGGNLSTITTEKEGEKQTLIAEQRFDKYGNLTYRKMGNGTETICDYDKKCLHLNSMNLTSNGVKMMENVYKYDNVDNILGISNSAAPSGEIGGTYSHSYQYDELNRLISASGTAKDRNYVLLMRYDVMSNPLYKTLYDGLQDNAKDATQLAPIILNTPSELQKIANRTYSTFRVNDVTYSPKK